MLGVAATLHREGDTVDDLHPDDEKCRREIPAEDHLLVTLGVAVRLQDGARHHGGTLIDGKGHHEEVRPLGETMMMHHEVAM